MPTVDSFTIISSQAQALLYPLLQFHDLRLSSYQRYYAKYDGTAFLDPRAVARAYLLYIGADATHANVEAVVVNRHIDEKLLARMAHRMAHDRLPDEFTTLETYYAAPVHNEEHVDGQLVAHLDERLMNTADVSPLLGRLDDLPPAMIVTCDYDILRDEGAPILVLSGHLQAICTRARCSSTTSASTTGTTRVRSTRCSTSTWRSRWRRRSSTTWSRTRAGRSRTSRENL